MSKVYVREDGLVDVKGLTEIQLKRIINSLNRKETEKAHALRDHLTESRSQNNEIREG